MRTRQNRFPISNLRQMCRNHDAWEKGAYKITENRKLRVDWGQAVAEKLSFTLVNKQGGWGQCAVLRLLILSSSRDPNVLPPCRAGLIFIRAQRGPERRELLYVLALLPMHFQKGCLHRDELISPSTHGKPRRRLEKYMQAGDELM